MANGPSIPSIEIMTKNVEMMGHTHDIDTSLLAPVADHFERVGKAAGFLVNQHFEYDVTALRDQIPGGMMGTLRAQLVAQNMLDKLPDVLAETATVRRELGYPGMATPFAQLVGTLAVLNIVTGKRYSVVPDEVIQYAAGFYGEPVAPIEPAVLDRILSTPRAKEILANPPEQPDFSRGAEAPARHGRGRRRADPACAGARGGHRAHACRRPDPQGLSDAVLARIRAGAAAHEARDDAVRADQVERAGPDDAPVTPCA